MDEDAMQWSLEQENAEVLAELAKDGIDLEGARDIEFLLAFPDEATAHGAQRALVAAGFDAVVRAPDDEAVDEEAGDEVAGGGPGDDHGHAGDPEDPDDDEDFGDDGFGDDWLVTVTRVLEPTASAITAVEERLAAIAAEHGGESDGWTFARGG